MRQRPLESGLGRRLVITCSMIAVEAVICVIDMDRDIRLGCNNSFHVGHRNVRVKFTEVHNRRTIGSFVHLPGYATAVI